MYLVLDEPLGGLGQWQVGVFAVAHEVGQAHDGLEELPEEEGLHLFAGGHGATLGPRLGLGRLLVVVRQLAWLQARGTLLVQTEEGVGKRAGEGRSVE